MRPPAPGEGAAIAAVHVRSWQVAYRGVFPDEYLDGLGHELAERTERWERFIARDVPLGRLLVATLDGRIEAFSSFGPAGAVRDHDGAVAGGLGEIYAFYADPDRWRQGAGRVLMERSVEALSAAGFRRAILWVLRDNPRARGFYEATGWQATGEESIFRRETFAAVEVCYARDL